MLRVFNVGQADALELIPVKECKYSGSSLIVDCGQGSKNIFSQLKNDNIYLILTHTHRDHIGGLSRLFDQEKEGRLRIQELWLPQYSDEVAKIANFILSLKGVKPILGKTGVEDKLKSIVHIHRLLKMLLMPFECKSIQGVSAGKNMCSHISILNPPLDPDQALGLNEGTSKYYWELQKKTNYQTIKSWITEEEFEKKSGSFISEGWDHEVPNLTKFEKSDFDSRMLFIYGFFFKYEFLIDAFADSGDPDDFENLGNAVKLTSNNISIVLEYNDRNFSCLLTGDIDRSTLRRCVTRRRGEDIKIFKFPHHGSRKSLDEASIKKLNPEIVIVSHDNGIFGKQKDPHPNIEVIEALERLEISAAYTNDVIKKGKTIRNKAGERPHNFVEIVIPYN